MARAFVGWATLPQVLKGKHLFIGVNGVDSTDGCRDCWWESCGVLPVHLVMIVFCKSSFFCFLPYLAACHLLNLLTVPCTRITW